MFIVISHVLCQAMGLWWMEIYFSLSHIIQAPKLNRQLSSNSTPEPSVSDAAPHTTSSSYSSVLSSTSSITTSATTTSATTTTSSTTTTELHALPTDTPPGNGERRYSGGKQALESHQPSHPSPDHPPVDEAPLEATSESRLTPAVEDLESKSPKGGRSGSLLQTKPEAPPTQVTTDATKGKQKTEENAGKNGAGGETSSGYESSHEESSPKLHVSETMIKQHSTSEAAGVDDHSASNGASKKASKAKDPIKRLRLKLLENLKDGVAQCSMTTVAGQMINFRFSTQYDKPKDIFQNMVSQIMSYSVRVSEWLYMYVCTLWVHVFLLWCSATCCTSVSIALYVLVDCVLCRSRVAISSQRIKSNSFLKWPTWSKASKKASSIIPRHLPRWELEKPARLSYNLLIMSAPATASVHWTTDC